MYKKSSKEKLRVFEFLFLDIICFCLSLVISYFFRHKSFITADVSEVYGRMALFTVLADIAVSFAFSTFDGLLYRNKYVEFGKTVKHSAAVILLSVLYLFSVQNAQEYSRIVLYLTFIFYFLSSYFSRLVLKKILRNHISENDKRSLLLITSKALAAETVNNIKSDPVREYRISGIVLIDGASGDVGGTVSDVEIVSEINSVPEYVNSNCVDEILIVSDDTVSCPQKIISDLSKTGVVIHMNINFPQDMYGKVRFVEDIANSYTVATVCMNTATDLELAIKRLTDIIGGLVGCVLTGILCIFVAPAIKIASPGPLFFTQKRVGKNGRIFNMYKFRSMVPDAEQKKEALESENKVEGGLMFKMDFDPRIIGNKVLPDGTKKTGIGEFIRKTSIDEFPQFLNVLLGQMSLVGTRPPTVKEYQSYSLHHKARLTAKPGITGMWQTGGRSEITDFEEVVALDTEYINNWSIGLDIKILLKTVKAVVKHDGAM